MNRLILKIILWLFLSVAIGIGIYISYSIFVKPNLQSEYNTPEETLKLVEQNFENKSLNAAIEYNGTDVKVLIDIKNNKSISGKVYDSEIELYDYENKLYSCINDICAPGIYDLKFDLNELLDKVESVKGYLNYTKYFYETQSNGDQVLQIDGYGKITISNDGTQVKIEGENQSFIIAIKFNKEMVKKPNSFIEL